MNVEELRTLVAALGAFQSAFWSYHFQAGMAGFQSGDEEPSDDRLWATLLPLHDAIVATRDIFPGLLDRIDAYEALEEAAKVVSYNITQTRYEDWIGPLDTALAALQAIKEPVSA